MRKIAFLVIALAIGPLIAAGNALSSPLAPGAFSTAPRSCIVGPWVSRDKALHFVGTFGLVFGTDFAIKQLAPDFFAKAHDIGLAPGIIAGSVREIYKATTPGYACEYASMTYDLAGLAAGYYATERWLVMPVKGGVAVSWNARF